MSVWHRINTTAAVWACAVDVEVSCDYFSRLMRLGWELEADNQTSALVFTNIQVRRTSRVGVEFECVFGPRLARTCSTGTYNYKRNVKQLLQNVSHFC